MVSEPGDQRARYHRVGRCYASRPLKAGEAAQRHGGVGEVRADVLTVIQHLGCSILSELTSETPASRMYVEAASLTLGARLLQKYCDNGVCAPTESSAHNLDHIRLRRVKWLGRTSCHRQERLTSTAKEFVRATVPRSKTSTWSASRPLRFSLSANGAKATLDPATPQKPPKKIGKKIESPEAPAPRSAPRPLLQPPVARRRRPAP